ncbi:MULTISPECIES: molybdopterin molybdotransferase MoeA [unclassified Streptomyces]|uniref:molybdopterin molybdotransferase MoeA n=1 Tax=unclassified Streptomyces TaxID=2593676 RepID=UPI00081B497D|nr:MULTISPECIES: molybdopterin molybdotransferase MoeA [unclassified Streptomyces]SCE23469.1 molybdopterin molybdotransferase [Streptomyces sp. PalvLS-984]SDC75219.1 molybdopterin molybdotransferase [Streptomyces sp. AmelKG-A3]
MTPHGGEPRSPLPPAGRAPEGRAAEAATAEACTDEAATAEAATPEAATAEELTAEARTAEELTAEERAAERRAAEERAAEERAVEEALALVGRREPHEAHTHSAPERLDTTASRRPEPFGSSPSGANSFRAGSHPGGNSFHADSQPGDPGTGNGQTSPAQPSQHIGPGSPTGLGRPAEPGRPAELGSPTGPIRPAEPGSPAESGSPAEPGSTLSAPCATSWHDARALARRLGRAAPLAAHRLPLERALGHVLAEAVVALTDLPSFDTSAMDGWAVAGPGPWAVRMGEGLLAGRGEGEPLLDGQAVRIATGARIPAEATAVIRSEHARFDEVKGLLHATRAVVPGQDIRPRGQECRSGDQLLPVGTVVTPPVLGLAAAAGYDALVAVPLPRVDVLVLGDELLTAGLPQGGRIRDALGPMLGPWLRSLGAEVSAPQRLGDDAEALRRALTTSDADLVLTTGGTAAGPVDHVHPVLAEIGAELLVDGVSVRPGHPMLLARLADGGPYVVGLPGNPLAAVAGLMTLAEPLLRGIAGRPAQDSYHPPVREEVRGHPLDTRLIPVVHRADSVMPLHYSGPAMLRGIAAADGLAVVPPGGVRSGAEVEILDLPWTSAEPWTEGCFT